MNHLHRRRVARQAWAKAQSYISGADDDRDRGDETDDCERTNCGARP